MLSIILATALLAACTEKPVPTDEDIAKEMRHQLTQNILDVWYPASIDSTYGGFLSDFSYDWQPTGEQNKMLVSQARQVWTAATAAALLGNDTLAEIATHGFRFLADHMFDKKGHGFFMFCNRQGVPLNSGPGLNKNPYSNAFAIYALTAYLNLTHDPEAMELAGKTFLWLDSIDHDPQYGGYFSNLAWRGKEATTQASGAAITGERAGRDWKGQNTSLHLLEAFTSLYKMWPDSIVRVRLEEMLHLMRDTFTTDKGYLTLFMERDWTPVSFRDSSDEVRMANQYLDHVSFGHDIEAAYLMLEAAEALGLPGDGPTLTVARKMVDHTLARGWDTDRGGIYYEGYYFRGDSFAVINRSKNWWVQAEGLNSLLQMSRLFPQDQKYEQAFRKQWDYIKTYMIDPEHGGWYENGLDNDPDAEKAPKAAIWKANYHNARALMNCIRLLEKDSKKEEQTGE